MRERSKDATILEHYITFGAAIEVVRDFTRAPSNYPLHLLSTQIFAVNDNPTTTSFLNTFAAVLRHLPLAICASIPSFSLAVHRPHFNELTTTLSRQPSVIKCAYTIPLLSGLY